MGSSTVAVRPRFSWTLFIVLAAVSVATMPITAIWLSVLAPAVAIIGSLVALVWRSDDVRERMVVRIAAVAGGLFVGPAIYLALALL